MVDGGVKGSNIKVKPAARKAYGFNVFHENVFLMPYLTVAFSRMGLKSL